ncbi:MAG: cell wall hydrolase [Phyllobacteriaceae bacterium]|nr:cell wall hydrolase [Phyllobacteriaceae bacterium]
MAQTTGFAAAAPSPADSGTPLPSDVAQAGIIPVPTARPAPNAAIAAATDAQGYAPAALTASLSPAPASASASASATDAVPAPAQLAKTQTSARERDCLMRAMYFESNRSSPEGLLAVGTVVMHRVNHGAWGDTICGVVGAPKQFAPGVLTRKMQGNLADLQALADAIIAGKRHPNLSSNVMFFHVAGMKFPYKNMRYVHVAGGNTFYYKAPRKRRA